VQLKSNENKRIGATLGLMTLNLLCATGANAQATPVRIDQQRIPDAQAPQNAYDEPANEPGVTVLDSAVLFYKEDGGRVQAIEPVLSITVNKENGDVLSAKFTYDSLTGATPNGAAPATFEQTFVSPVGARGDDDDGGADGRTGASGGTIITDPVTGRQILEYTTDANTLPLDPGFRDHRWALDLGYSTQLNSNLRARIGASASEETDYRSFSGRAGLSQDLNNKNTTVSLGINFEYDQSRPVFGIPDPLTVMNGLLKGPNDSKTVVSIVAGVTQVLSRNLLVQANYSYGSSKGYQTDPYKVISVVDAVNGDPLRYLYESRPRSRTRQSGYAAVKYAVGSWVSDVSFRYYDDNWGIKSITGEFSEHIPIGRRAYIEPSVRYYHQSDADFFSYFLLSDEVLPQFASADSRLDKFNAITVGVRGGVKLTNQLELYGMAEVYRQSKSGALPQGPGSIAAQDLFAGVDAVSILTGLKYSF